MHFALHRRLACAAIPVVAFGVAVLFFFPPTRYSFYPACPIHLYLGVLCPGCGATRSLSALLHGQVREALRDNAFFVALFPFALGYACICLRRALHPNRFRWPHLPVAGVYALIAVAAVFTVTRNL